MNDNKGSGTGGWSRKGEKASQGYGKQYEVMVTRKVHTQALP